MGSGCSSSPAETSASCDEPHRRPRRHRFASVVDKADLPEPLATVAQDADVNDTIAFGPARDHDRLAPQSSRGVSPGLDRTISGTASPISPQRHSSSCPMLDEIDANRNLSMSMLAGPLLESKTTIVSSDMIGLSGNASIEGSTFEGDGPPLAVRSPLSPTHKPHSRQTAEVCESRINNDTSNNGNEWDFSLSSVPTSGVQSPAAGGNSVCEQQADQRLTSCTSDIT